MTRAVCRMMMVVALGAAMATSLVADDSRLRNAGLVFKEMTASVDSGIAQSLLAKAQCVAIIPGVKKGAIGIGGQYGRGYIACRQNGGWSAPGAIRIEGGSVGLQIGGTDTDVIMLVFNDRGADRLLSSRFTVGADAAVAAGPVGRQASAQTDATLMAEILAWSRSRGVFAGLSLQGSTLREDSSENKALYGKELPNREIVRGQVEKPAAAAEFLAELGKY